MSAEMTKNYLFLYVQSFLIFAFMAVGAPGFAQVMLPTGSGSSEAEAVVVPEDLTPEMVNELVARMSDDQVRALLLDRLDAVAREAAVGEPTPTFIQQVTTTAELLALSWIDAVQKIPAVVTGQFTAIANFIERFSEEGVLIVFGLTALAIGLSYALELAARFGIAKWQRKETGEEGDDLWGAVSYLFRRFCRELLGLVVFYVALRVIGSNLLSEEMVSFAAPFVLYMVLLPRVGGAVSRFVLAPNRPDLRLVNTSDKWAQYLHRNLVGLFVLIGFTHFHRRVQCPQWSAARRDAPWILAEHGGSCLYCDHCLEGARGSY